ncbi:carbon-phosphorus lyase complex subunit PhnI [Streptomyces sp. TS71-3]|uniref:carbon-phosphorus lyase complex subunit PhnI n=1 Tax=Streptomyces sp. TS71-3 TaxID=2733862 RepID=UPI001B2B5888|nr:carbon-phosphorus lyase complex subunit PhnI [Streptomyces sp. TS71-3]GHJ35617.1 phosphonate metabolism PhnI protein [Streptomyces sp. TS71-3]
MTPPEGSREGSGGQERQPAAEAAARLAGRPRHGGSGRRLELDQIMERLPLAVDRAMGEAGLWAPALAARALRQAQGDPLGAAQLLRAHRTTLPRLAVSTPVTSEDLSVTRRISSAFRNPPGGQLLGRTLDYVGRLLDLLPEDEGRMRAAGDTGTTAAVAHEGNGSHAHVHGADGSHAHVHGADGFHAHVSEPDGSHAHVHEADGSHAHPHEVNETDAPAPVDRSPRNLLAVLRSMDVVAPPTEGADPEPFDVTRAAPRGDAPRSAWLQAMARADTGSLMHTWYGSNWRPSGHEIPGEVRHGMLPVRVTHPSTGRAVTVTRVLVSEVQTFHSLTRAGELGRTLDVGYGLCFGRNDRKAISMAGLDLMLTHHRGSEGPLDEVLFTLDGLDSIGYAQHLKLPHHVEFRSLVERGRAVAAGRAAATARVDHGDLAVPADRADHGDKQ